MPMIIPPGGMAGFVQMTPASRLALTGGAPRANGSPRRRRSKKTRRAASNGNGKGRRKMKFGSPAWQKKYKVGKFRRK